MLGGGTAAMLGGDGGGKHRHVGGAAAMLGDEGRPPRRPRRGGEGKASVAILTRPPR